MTNPLGTGTRNLSVNLPVDELALLGKAAFQAGKSIGHFVRDLLFLGAKSKSPELAAKVAEVRRRYYGAVLLGLFVAMLAFNHDLDLRRPSRTARVRRSEAEEVAA